MTRKYNLILAVFGAAIIVLYFFLRFYHIDLRIIFDWDQENFSNQVLEIVRYHHFTLLGPRALSDRGFFMGPYFIYALVPFYMITHLHPEALIGFLVFYNIVFVVTAYLLISRLWNRESAMFFVLFWAVNALVVHYDTTPWNPITIPLGVLLTWHFLARIYNRGSMYAYLGLGATLGFFMNQHFQFGYLIVFSLIYILLSMRQGLRLSVSKLAVTIGGLAVMYTPLLAFDVRHQFLNMRLFLSFFVEDIGGNIEHGRWLWIETYARLFEPLTGYRDPILAVTTAVILGLLMTHMIRVHTGQKKVFYMSSLALWVILPIAYFFYNKRATDYYFVSLYPYIYITIIDALLVSRRYTWLIVYSIALMYINYHALTAVHKPNLLGLHYKQQTVDTLIEKVQPNSRFNISYDMPPGQATGYTYLINLAGITQTGDPHDPLIEIRVPKHDGDVSVNDAIGIKIPPKVRK